MLGNLYIIAYNKIDFIVREVLNEKPKEQYYEFKLR